MNVRWLALSLLVSGAYAVGCGSDDKESSSPCTTVCNCVVRRAGAEARADCMAQCSGVTGSDDPVQECVNRLAAEGITGCDAACFVFDDGTGGGSGGAGGSDNTGGSGAPGGASGSGGSTTPGGAGGLGAGGAAPPGGGPGTGGTSNPGGSGGAGPVAGTPVGRPCTSDAACGAGLTCLLPTSNALGEGGPANGYCSADCRTSPDVCQQLDPNSVCVRFGETDADPAFCLESCTVGPSQAAKCHRRQDLACDDVGAPTPGDGFCRPTCRGDADCGARRCDLASGFCVDEPLPAGALPIGSPCDPQAGTDPCSGFCVPLTTSTTGPGMCGAVCTLGAPGCGAAPGGPQPAAACLFPLTTADPGAGDLGLCGQLCDCDSECTADQRVCRPLDPADAQASGFAGYCGGATDPPGTPADHIPCD